MAGRNQENYGYRSLFRRARLSISMIIIVLLFGMVVLHYIEHYSYLDAFYFMSMLATGQGPTIAPATYIGKIFVAIMAFVSVGTVVTALAFLFGPFFIRLMKIEEKRIKKDERMLTKKLEKL